MKKYGWIALVLMGVGLSSSAHALPMAGISLIGGVNSNLGHYTTSNTPGLTSRLSYTGGLGTQFGPFEVQALYNNLSSGNNAGSSNWLQIPVLLTSGLGGAKVGLGGFFETGVSGTSGTNYGLSGGVKVGIPASRFSLQGLVNFGLKDMGSSFKQTSALLLLGIHVL